MKIYATKASGAAGGSALRVYYRLLFGRINGAITHDEYRNFTGPAAIRHNYFLRRSSRLFLSFPPALIETADTPVVMNNLVTLSTFSGTGGQYATRLQLGQSFSRDRMRLSTSLTGTAASGGRHKHTTSASFAVTQYLKRDEMYGRLQSGLQPDNTLEKLTLGRRFRYKTDHTTTLEMTHQPDAKAKTRLKMALAAERERYRLGVSSEIDRRGEYRLTFTLASSFMRPPTEPRSMTWRNERDARGAVILVNTFLDENGNGIQEQSEPPLPQSDVKVTPPPDESPRHGTGCRFSRDC